MNTANNDIWHGAYKIPWDDPAFSRRMLAEHLSQDHDLASRCTEWIDRQAAWIHERLLGGEPARILDLGCGPGLYSHRLSLLGHRCMGIDFGPASIEYARANAPDSSQCEFVLGDVRRAAFDGPFDLAMILYGELNVFSPDEAAALLRKVRGSLAPHGRLIVEMQTPDAVEQTGRAEVSEQKCDTGLFSDRPHTCRTESRWLQDQMTAVQTYLITEADDGRTEKYRNTTQAWPDGDLVDLFADAGFTEIVPCEDWPSDNDRLKLWMAKVAL